MPQNATEDKQSELTDEEIDSLYLEWQEDKKRLRRQDWARIARGEATPEEIQHENSLFSKEDIASMEIDWSKVVCD